MRTLKLFALIACLITPSLAHAQKFEELAGKSKLGILLLTSTTIIQDKSLNQLSDAQKEILKTSKCIESPRDAIADELFGTFASIAVAAVGHIYEKIMDEKLAKLERLKKNSQNEYSSSLAVTSEELKSASCAVLFRNDDKKEGLFVVLKLNPKKDKAKNAAGFTFTPIHLSVDKPTVSTKKEKKSTSKINVTAAISIKAVLPGEHGIETVNAIGASAVAMSNVELASKSNHCSIKECFESDLIPYVTKDTVVSVSISVRETGITGINFDAQESKLKAIKAAYGPAITEIAKELVK